MNNTLLKNRLVKTLAVTLLAAFCLSGCGFKPRGSYLIPVSMQVLCFDAATENELAKKLRKRLQISGASFATAGQDCAELVLITDNLERRTLSLFANAQVAEYEMIYKVSYAIAPKNGEMTEHSFELYRDYQDDPDAVLAKSKEMKILLSELRTLAAERIVRHLAQFK